MQLKKAGTAKLKEILVACVQSMRVFYELAEYHLQRKQKFSHVLPGKFLPNPNEDRFGWYRQAHSGNFAKLLKQKNTWLLDFASATRFVVSFSTSE